MVKNVQYFYSIPSGSVIHIFHVAAVKQSVAEYYEDLALDFMGIFNINNQIPSKFIGFFQLSFIL